MTAPTYPAFDPPSAERKQVTILFCDIADYTSRARVMDPEDLSDEIQAFQSMCARAVKQFGGRIENYYGDGALALFESMELAPERAVHAGLAMVRAVQNADGAPHPSCGPIAIRVGIATGLAVVGATDEVRDGNAPAGVIGEATNLAARLQALAAPNSVVVSSRTRKLTQHAFKFAALGKHRLKGFDAEVEVWQIKERGRRLAKTARAPAAFIGREKELAQLQEMYSEVTGGRARFVHISGEPGIGKSRLLRAFERRLAAPKPYRVRLTCAPYFETSPHLPITDACHRWLGISESDAAAARRAGILRGMRFLKMSDAQTQSLVHELLGAPSAKAPPLECGGAEKRALTNRMLVDILVRMSRHRPLLLIVEDLHWADDSTKECINLLIQEVRDAALFGVFIARPGFTPDWQRARVETLHLGGFNRRECKAMIDAVFGDTRAPFAIKHMLIRKSDGVPMFIEESGRLALHRMQHGGKLAATFALPDTLQDSLNARIDQTEGGKTFAQLASAFGPDFRRDAAFEIAAQNRIDAAHGLDELLKHNLIHILPDKKHARYRFRHAMLQEAAYQSLLRKIRRRYHRQIADWFAHNDADLSRQHPELLASHYGKANAPDAAVPLWLQAGRASIAKSAAVESVEHLQQGLARVKELSAAARAACELDLLLNLGVALTAKGGYFGEQVEETYACAAEIANTRGDHEKSWTALYGLWRCTISRAEYGKAMKLSVQLKNLSERGKDKNLLTTACGIQGMTRMVSGKFTAAAKFYRKSLAFSSDLDDKNAGVRFGQDPYVTTQGLGAVNRLILNQIDESARDIAHSIRVARNVGHPYTIAETLRVAAMYEQIARNMPGLMEVASEARRLSQRHGFDGLLAASNIFVGFAKVADTRKKTALRFIKHNLTLYEKNYGLLFLPYFHAVLAEAQLLAGARRDAFASAEGALNMVYQHGETWFEPVLLSLKAAAAERDGLADPAEIQNWQTRAAQIAARNDAHLFLHRMKRPEGFMGDYAGL